jgi:hypothetical protein
VLRPPVALEVLAAGEDDGDEVAEGSPACGGDGGEPLPRRLLQVRSTAADARARIDGRVRVAAGPWRMEEGWWSDEPVARDYWDVELVGGGLYRIYRERESGEWWADGMYD